MENVVLVGKMRNAHRKPKGMRPLARLMDRNNCENGS